MQIGMFDGSKEFKITKPIRLIELFGGIGCQASALERLCVKFEHYRMCDFDKYAVQSYNAIHETNFVPSDITKITADDLAIVETDKYDYIMTYSFPCTDLSKAGQQKGMEKGSGTRSGLLWEVERLLDECNELPQVLLMENVPDVIGTNNMPHFAEWIKKLESLGYKNYWQVLNAKDFGIPQNRERCFMVSLLGDYYYNFPEPTKLELRLKDMLEDEVDEKYYLSDKALKGIINSNFECSKLENRTEKNGVIPTLCARDYKDPKLVLVAQLDGFESSGRVYSADGLAPTINTMGVGNRQPKIQERNLKQQLANKIIESGRVKEYDIIRHSYSNSRMENKRKIAESNNLSPTLDTRCDCLGVVEPQVIGGVGDKKSNGGTQWYQHNLRIRKLVPLETWRLMGLTDEQFDKAKASGVSNSQLYKQAGNGIVVNVLMAIFKNLI